GGGAAGGGEGHVHFDLAFVLDADGVDQTQVVDVDRNLGVVAALDRVHDVLAQGGGLGGLVFDRGRRSRGRQRRRLLAALPFGAQLGGGIALARGLLEHGGL